jgi:hypothetical protein
MDDTTLTGDGPISTTPPGNPDLGMPGDTPLADAPAPEAPALAPDSTEPAGDAAEDDAILDDDDEPAGADLAEAADEAVDALEAELPAEAQTDDELPAPPPPPTGPEPRRLSRGERDMVDRVRQHFAACGRCGYLIADLQLLLGEATLQTAAIQSRDGWLRLEGDERLRPLLVNAYGIRLDLGFDSMDGLCPECRRRFVFVALDNGRVRLKLRT